MEACESYLEEVKPECLKPILTVLGRVVQLFPEEGPQLIRPCLNKMMNKVFGTEEVSHSYSSVSAHCPGSIFSRPRPSYNQMALKCVMVWE